MRRSIGLVTVCLISCVGCVSQGTRYDVSIVGQPTPAGLAVNCQWIGQGFFNVNIHNATNDQWALDWDQSTYINSIGQATRLIRGETRQIFVASAQPLTVIPPNADITAVFTLEVWATNGYLDRWPYVEKQLYQAGKASSGAPARLRFTFAGPNGVEAQEMTVAWSEKLQ